MSSGLSLKMSPLLPNRSRRSGSLKALRDEGLRSVAIVAITFINFKKRRVLRETFTFRPATLATRRPRL